jgi:hypothetical protein
MHESQYEPVFFGPPIDDPELDCTPFQSRAYSRGVTWATRNVVEIVNGILDGKDSGTGVFGDEGLEKLRRRLLELHPLMNRNELHG